MRLGGSKKVKSTVEIRQKLRVLECKFALGPRVLEEQSPVICDLRNRGLQLDTRVPCSSPGVTETGPARARMTKRCIDDMSFRNAIEQFRWPNRRPPMALHQLALIGSSVEFTQISDNLGWKRKRFEHASIAVLGGNEPVGA